MSGEGERVSDALLFEGYALYPYAASALKNRQRTPLGTLFPDWFCRTADAGDAAALELQCVAAAPPEDALAIRLRFLHLVANPVVREVPLHAPALGGLARAPLEAAFAFSPLEGRLVTTAEPLRAGLWMIRVRAENRAPPPEPAPLSHDAALPWAIASPHLVLALEGGAFASAIDPPAELAADVARCRSTGTWPVLLGPPDAARALLSAPIILNDHPAIAPESPGDFFDGTEMDEMLTLRVLTLTEDEKREAAAGDPRVKSVLERTAAAGLHALRALHGTWRASPALRPGTRVRLHPSGRADIMDLALEGRCATVSAVERDLEGRIHVAVTVDDDPGKDLGSFGHRFFFRPDELERV